MERKSSMRQYSDGELGTLIMDAQAELHERLLDNMNKRVTQAVDRCEVSGAKLDPQAPGFDLDHLFTYHPPNARQLTQYEAIRTAAKYFATVLLQNTPVCADQGVAINALRNSVMFANASIALDGRQ